MARQRATSATWCSFRSPRFGFRVIGRAVAGARADRQAVGRRGARPAGAACRCSSRSTTRCRSSAPSASCSPSARDGRGSSRTGPPPGKMLYEGTPGAVGPDRDHRARGAGRPRHLRRRTQRLGRHRDRGGARRHRRDRPRAAVHLVAAAWSSTACRTRGCWRPSPTCPGGALEHLGALTFPTYAEDGGSQVASTRMLVMPSSVRGRPAVPRPDHPPRAEPHRDRGPRRRCPCMGLRGHRGVPRRARDPAARPDHPHLGAAARRRAEVTRRCRCRRTFNNTDQEWHYALSWMACDYIAATHGESRLWELVDAMHNGGEGTSDAPAGPRARAGARVRRGRARPPRRGADPQPLRLSRGSPRRAGIPTAAEALCALGWESRDHRCAAPR